MAWVRIRAGRYYAHWRNEHGEKVSRALRHARNLTHARHLAQELERKAELVRLGLEQPATEDITFAEAVRRHLAALPPEFASRASLEGRLRNRVVPHLGQKLVRRITRADVQLMIAANADVSPQTREHLRIATQAVFTFLVGGKLVAENPARELGKLDVPEHQPRYLERAELPVLLEEVPPQWRAAFLVSLGTGVRKGELLALRKSDVLLERRAIVVRGSNQRATTKSKRDRQVPIPLGLMPVIREQLRAAPGPFLFPNPSGRQWSRTVRLHDIIRRALGRAGLVTGYDVNCKGWGSRAGCGYSERRTEKGSRHCPRCGNTLRVAPVARPIRWKELRSTFATLLTSGTGDIRVVQKILGHSDLNVTARRYAFAMPSHLQAQVDSVDLLPTDGSHLPPKSAQARRNKTTQRNPASRKH